MDLLHHVWKSLLGGECLRFGHKVDRIDRVLDVGTGTGKAPLVSGRTPLKAQVYGLSTWRTHILKQPWWAST